MAGAVDGLRIIREAAEEASPWRSHRHSPGALGPVCSTVTALEPQPLSWPGPMNISGGSAVCSAACSARSSPKVTSAHLWCLQPRHPLQKYSRRKVQSETHTDQWGGEGLGRSECLILAHFSENFLHRGEAQLQKGSPGTTSPSQCKEPECQRWKRNFPKMASCNNGRRASKNTASFRILQVIL